MAANTTPIYPLVPTNIATQLTNATGTTLTTIYTAGSNGSRIDQLTICSDDSAGHDVEFYINIGGNDILIGTIAVAAGAGATSAASPHDVLADEDIQLKLLDPFNNPVLYLKAGALLKVKLPVAMTAAKTMHISGLVGEY